MDTNDDVAARAICATLAKLSGTLTAASPEVAALEAAALGLLFITARHEWQAFELFVRQANLPLTTAQVEMLRGLGLDPLAHE